MHYQDSHLIMDFLGDGIRSVDVPDLGTLVTVRLVLTPDSGYTTFSLLLPCANVPAEAAALPGPYPVTTYAVTTVHHTGVVPGFQSGQQDHYAITELAGTAT